MSGTATNIARSVDFLQVSVFGSLNQELPLERLPLVGGLIRE